MNSFSFFLRSIFPLLIILTDPIFGQSQIVALPKVCKFKVADDMSWASPSFNDNSWESRLLGTSRQDTSGKRDLFVWYRIKVIVPSSLKKPGELGKGLRLNLGKIDDVDFTFFNGKLVGQTGSLPPEYISKFQADRVYNIPLDIVEWDKENVIAVRVFSPDPWVGMYEGPYKLGPLQWSDSIAVEQSITQTQNSSFSTTVKLRNNGNSPFDGTIRYSITDIKNNELFTETKPIKIQPIKGAENAVVFSKYKPVNNNIFKVGYAITEDATGIAVDKYQLYLSDKQLKIVVEKEPVPVIQNKIKDAFTSIRFQDQQQQGYLVKRLNKNLEERLLKMDEVGTFDGYLERPGHHPWAGEHIGKYLETASNVWRNTGDERLKLQMDRLMYQLVHAQLPDGYLGTYTPEDYWTSWDVWSHKYNLYGLLGYYKATGYQPALDACKKMGDLLCKTFGNKPGQLDIILAGTHMGMASTSVLDPMVELYKYTGDKKYLDFCYYILEAWEQKNGPKIISALLTKGKVTAVGNGKAYEMLSTFVGLANLYRTTGDEAMLKPLFIAWNDIVKNQLYVTGTTSSHEYFQADDYLPAGKDANMGEGCVTTTWIQFNQQLFEITGDLKYFDQIELSVYNHLLAAENPQTGCVSYYTPLMGAKPYTCYITCCQSSVPRGIAMVPYFTFGNIKEVPTVMMYEPATYKETIATANKKIVRLSFRVESNFPEIGKATISVSPSQNSTFPVALRVPTWCQSFTAVINGKSYKGTNKQLLVINRSWKEGDKIKVSFQIPFKMLPGGKSYPNQMAIQRGPQVLALDSILNMEVLRMISLNKDKGVVIDKPVEKNIPGLLPAGWIGRQAYPVSIADNKNRDKKQQIILVPFADASQTGGSMKVWLPLILKN